MHYDLWESLKIKLNMAGEFVNFYLPYVDANGNGISNKDQAMTIVTEAQNRLASGAPSVAITYSANYGQSIEIIKTYKAGDWNTNTDGKNQAAIMADMEKLMGGKYSSLQHLLEIAPITTMTYTGYGGQTQFEVVQADLAHIKSLLENGWDVLGWINQKSELDYAVGGGVAGALPVKINDLIQTTLSNYAKQYSK